MLILARHGSTALNESGRVQGQQDVGLSEEGRAEADRLGEWLAGRYQLTCAVQSPTLRACETVSAIKRHFPASLTTESHIELRERDYGPFEGFDSDQLRESRRHAGLSLKDIRQNWANADDVESDAEVYARFQELDARLHLVSRSTDEDILVVSHRGMIKAVVCAILGISPDRPHPFNIGTASAVVFALSDGFLELDTLWQNMAAR